MRRTQLPIGLLLIGLMACSTPRASAELKIRVAGSHLAPVPMAQRKDVADAERAIFLAQWQLEYTKTELGIAKTDVKVAKNDVAKAKLSAKTADVREAHATNAEDQSLMGEAAQLEKAASLEKSVADQELARAKQRVDYLVARQKAEELVLHREEARAEYAKAQSMAAAGVHPPDFNAQRYQAQYQNRKQLAASAMAQASQKKKALDGIEQRLSAMRAQLDQVKKPRGSLPLEDPNAVPAPLPTAVPKTGTGTGTATATATATGTGTGTATGTATPRPPPPGGNPAPKPGDEPAGTNPTPPAPAPPATTAPKPAPPSDNGDDNPDAGAGTPPKEPTP